MIMHSSLRRRHTWPFELVEIVCEEVHTDPDHPHFHQNLGGQEVTVDPGEISNGNDKIPNEITEEEKAPVQVEAGHHLLNLIQYENEKCFAASAQEEEEDEGHLNLNERTRLLSEILETESENEVDGDGSKNKNKTHNGCTCSGKSSNNGNNHAAHTLQKNSSRILPQDNNNSVTGNKCKSQGECDSLIISSHQNNETNHQNQQTFTSESSNTNGHSDTLNQDGISKNSTDLNKSGKKSPVSGFQPIQGKFNFLIKKNRESKKKRKERESTERENSSTSAGSNSNTSGSGFKHKDFCPHSKYQQDKHRSQSQNRDGGIISPLKKSTSSNASSVFTNKNNKSVTTASNCSKKNEADCFTSTSSNNNSPSHSQHSQGLVSLGSIGTSTQGILNKNGGIAGMGSSIGSGGSNSNSGSGLKGSVTVVTANIIHCNSHHETEGKIPSANGTATGALSLQVNTANGEVKKTITLWQNYYPEGQWGWIVVFCAFIVQAINHGLQLGVSTLLVKTDRRFGVGEQALLGALASTSIGISLFLSPVWISFCKTKSTRLSGVFGGLLASLGCLFTSFATQFHQLFFSHGCFIGVGVGLSRDSSTLMVGQYFKRKREMVEIFVVAGSGVGIALMSNFVHFSISSIGWVLGLQAVTGATLLTFFLGTCYRSASLYHPQRRAILHLKNQKKKAVQVKDITKREVKPPFLDYSCLKSKTLQILLASSSLIALGINNPLIYLGLESRESKLDEFSYALLHVYIGVSWVLGCCFFGFIAVQKNQDCRVSKQYLCQVASVICGISIITFTAVKGYSGYVVFTWVYGFSLGAYNYALKIYTFERFRARHFARAWSFVQGAQAIPIMIGIPLCRVLNQYFGRKSGYYTSAAAVFIGSVILFLTDVRRSRLSRKKANNSSMKTTSTSDTTQTPKMRRLSFAFPAEPISPHHPSKPESGDGQASVLDPVLMSKELTCISEEGLGEIDFQDICFDDWAEYLGGDCITSCNKVENCLASEYDPDFSLLNLDRRNRRWSRNSIPFPGGPSNISSHSHALPSPNVNGRDRDNCGDNSGEQCLTRMPHQQGTGREIPVFRNHPWGGTRGLHVGAGQRSITVIDEASV